MSRELAARHVVTLVGASLYAAQAAGFVELLDPLGVVFRDALARYHGGRP